MLCRQDKKNTRQGASRGKGRRGKDEGEKYSLFVQLSGKAGATQHAQTLQNSAVTHLGGDIVFAALHKPD